MCWHAEPQGAVERPLGEGDFDIYMPDVLTNSRPVIVVQPCGRIDVLTVSAADIASWNTCIQWPVGEVEAEVAGKDGKLLGNVRIWSDGTNVFLSVNEGRVQYRVEADTNGTSRLIEVKP